MIDVVFSFDTTGSMYSCIGEVRRKVTETVNALFDVLPDLKVSIIGHGDYVDGKNLINILNLTDEKKKIIDFIKKVPNTYGGCAPEAYEVVLQRCKSLEWRKNARKIIVLIGDDVPHPVGFKYDGKSYDIDWRFELRALIGAGISVYPIQALGRRHATHFWQEVADTCNTPKLDLPQFSDIIGFLAAICTHQQGDMSKAAEFERIVAQLKIKYNNVLDEAIAKLTGKAPKKRKLSEHNLFAVHPSRFQILDVDSDIPIKNFVEENGLRFKIGRGFYEFTKRVTIQDYKEVVIRDKVTDEMFSGDKAREILGIPVGTTAKVSPGIMDKYIGFVQSTSANRKLLGGTRFLYELEDYER